MERPDRTAQVLWLALVMVTSVLVGACAAGLFWVLNAGPVASVGAGGGAFVAVATIGIGIIALFRK